MAGLLRRLVFCNPGLACYRTPFYIGQHAKSREKNFEKKLLLTRMSYAKCTLIFAKKYQMDA